jgi:hypothetical protein
MQKNSVFEVHFDEATAGRVKKAAKKSYEHHKKFQLNIFSLVGLLQLACWYYFRHSSTK